MAYESSMTNIITKGYSAFTSTDEKCTVSKALKALRINPVIYGKFVAGDNIFQKPLNTTALTGLTLATTNATTSIIENIMDSSTFVDAGTSSNYTRALEILSITGETLTDGGAHTAYTVAHSPLAGYKVYKNAAEVTTGFTLTGATLTFTVANLVSDVIKMDYTYNTTQNVLKVTTDGTPAVVTSVANTGITTSNYIVFKAVDTIGTGTIKYEISRDAGVTFKEIFNGNGYFISAIPVVSSSIVYRVTLTGNATVSKVGFNFR